MRPLDFYRLGIELSSDAYTEARQRTVVNRLYYGLHHEACCRLFQRAAVSARSALESQSQTHRPVRPFP